MLIYNSQKEFIGIDQKDLQTLGFANISQLRSEAADFADLFVRAPGYIHNFKHVHWIDYITCADSAEDPKIIIDVKGKTFKAEINITNCFLTDKPTSKAYIITLNGLRGLTLDESENIAQELANKKSSSPSPAIQQESFAPTPSFEDNSLLSIDPQMSPTPPMQTQSIVMDDSPLNIELDDLDTYDDLSTQNMLLEEDSIETQSSDNSIDISDDLLSDDFNFDEPQESEALVLDDFDSFSDDALILEETPTPSHEDALILDDSIGFDEPVSTPAESIDNMFDDDMFQIDDELLTPPSAPTNSVTQTQKKVSYPDVDLGADFNPEVASEELGLPVDLIEEFLQDFIEQANEFKDDIYTAIDKADIATVKSKSHMLKGVAANLRIENALNALNVVNTSSDFSELALYTNAFYKIIAQLSGEETQEETQAQEDELLNYIDNAPSPQETPTPALATQISSSGYDKQSVADAIGLDLGTFNELFNDFIDASKVSSTIIHEAISVSDFDKCVKEATKLSSMSSNMQVNSIVSEIEYLIATKDHKQMLHSIDTIDAIIADISK